MKFLALVAAVCLLSFVQARPGKESRGGGTAPPIHGVRDTENEEDPITPPLVEPEQNARSEPQINKNEDAQSRRKAIRHTEPYSDVDLNMQLFRETLSRHMGHEGAKIDPCRYMRCGPGEECEIGDEGAKCVCRKHCKQRYKPLCGTDEEYYDNHCEMHRRSCLSGRDIYDARHKDCFYKASDCSPWDLNQYQDMLLQFYRNMITSTTMIRSEKTPREPGSELHRRRRSAEENPRKHRRNGLRVLPDEAETTPINGKEKSPPPQDEFDVSNQEIVTDQKMNVKAEMKHEKKQMLDPLEVLDAMRLEEIEDTEHEIMTRDTAGDMVKYIFSFLDLDGNRKIGSDEMWEITSLQHLDNILPGPCTLFHLLKYGDANDDRILDISETFKIFNITVFRLEKQRRYVQQSAVYGNPVEMECGIEGEPEPAWHRYGRHLKEENGAKISGRILHLTDVTSRKAGNYTCSARKRPSMEQTIDLQVMIPPTVEVHPRTQHPTVDSSATIKCRVEGRPRPAITWRRNGENLDLKSGRYILSANSTELHFNSVTEDDTAAYSCFAHNAAGEEEDVGAIYAQVSDVHEGSFDAGSYFVFHRNGISVVTPHTCQTLRLIHGDEKVPGLLIQDKLCGLSDTGARECAWSESVSAGTRYIYAAQPTEDRLIVVDKELQRIVEVITTDLMPVQLFYVASTDQIYILCWVDEGRQNSVLQVIHAASIAGAHFAEHIRPVIQGGHMVYDRSVYDVFIPPETPFNPTSQYGYVIHQGEPVINRLDFTTMSYSTPIDLTVYGCLPTEIGYLPIGGLLRVSCLSTMDNRTLHDITLDVETDSQVGFTQGYGMTKEYFSPDYTYAIRLHPQKDVISLHNISNSGRMQEFMIIRTNFQVADTYFVRKKYNPDAMVAYMVAKNQGDVMYVDLEKKKVEIIDGMTPPVSEKTWPWAKHTRKLTPSGWFGWYLATAGRTGVEIIGLNSNQVLCRMNDFVHATAISWSSGEF